MYLRDGSCDGADHCGHDVGVLPESSDPAERGDLPAPTLECVLVSTKEPGQEVEFSRGGLLNRRRVFEYAAERRLPAIHETDSLTREGGLMSYGPDRREIFERSAALVDRILKGTKPADLPVEQPTRFLFVLNLKTAKAMGLNVPNTLLALADEVIE